MRDIDRHPLATQYMDPPRKLGNKEFDILVNADLSDTTEPVLLLAVTTKEDNEIVGWVSYYPDAPERIASLRKQKDFPPDSLVLEVSYSKLFSKWPPRTRFVNRRDNLVTEDNKGVAINGVKQTLLIITEMEDKISAQSGQPSRPLYVTAYTDPTNVASETVLKRNGFRLLPKQIKYEGELNRAWIKQAAVH
ncbi:MAG: hypothetical protein Q7S79_00920 [bacterium]|nr:hypothetical protein [bacterium]